MNTRRSFFKSLALIAAGLALPKLPASRFEVDKKVIGMKFNPREYYGTWRFESGAAMIINAPTFYAIKPPEDQEIDYIFHLRES